MMTEYEDKWLGEISSDFIVRTCQLLPKYCATVSDRIDPSTCCWPITYTTYCGSSQEFFIRPLNSCIDDVDALLNQVDELAFVDDFPVLPSDVSRLADTIECHKIEPYPKCPGFVRLRALGTLHYDWKYKKYNFTNRTSLTIYIKLDRPADAVILGDGQSDILLDVERLCQLSKTVRGPAIRFQEVGCFAFDEVHSMWCPQWPREAQEWLTRRRHYGWPTIATISEVAQQGCHVVYVQHRSCRDDELQWRYSFSVAEVILIQSWTQIQQIVYHLLRFFAKRELIQKDCPKDDEVFCTYHLKTLMLWTCEEMSPEWWISSSAIAICCELLHKILKWLKRRFCPNYFTPKANLFHGDQWNPKMCENSERKLVKFCISGILCRWFVENYILPFTRKYFKVEVTGKVIPHFMDYVQPIFQFRKASKLESLDVLFSTALLCCNKYARDIVPSQDRLEPRYCLYYTCSARKVMLLTSCEMPMFPIPENVWFLKYFDATLYGLNVAYDLMCGQMSCDSELFAECVKGISLTPKFVRCQYPIFPKPLTAERSRFQFLRAQDFMETLTGLNNRSEFQLLSLLSKESLRKALESDDSQSNIIASAAMVYLAALHFASSENQIVIDLCSAVSMRQTTHVETETLNAGCLLFIDDVARIVGFCLLFEKFNENMYLNKRHIYLDLRLTFTVLAYHLTVITALRMSKQLELNSNLPISALPLDRFLLVITKRKFCTLMKSSIYFNEIRRCVYCRTDSVKTNLILSVNPLIAKETFIEGLTEFALENMTSFYSVIRKDFGFKCNTIDCYRALYLYKCRKYDEVLHLCERILHEPDLQSHLKEFAFANILMTPPLDSFFDGDVQSLLGFHTLFYYLSAPDDDLWAFDSTAEATIAHFIALAVHSGKNQLSYALDCPYVIKCHYFLGRHFLARYLKLRCCIDCCNPFTETLAEFASMKSNLPIERIIRRSTLRKLHNV